MTALLARIAARTRFAVIGTLSDAFNSAATISTMGHFASFRLLVPASMELRLVIVSHDAWKVVRDLHFLGVSP